MNDLVPRQCLLKPMVRKYPKPDKDRRSVLPKVILHITFINPVMEDSLYDLESMLRFAGVNLDGIWMRRQYASVATFSSAIVYAQNRGEPRKGPGQG